MAPFETKIFNNEERSHPKCNTNIDSSNSLLDRPVDESNSIRNPMNAPLITGYASPSIPHHCPEMRKDDAPSADPNLHLQ